MNNFLTNMFRHRRNRDPAPGEQMPYGTQITIPDFLMQMLSGQIQTDLTGNKYLSRDIYELALARACINKIATECSKATPTLTKPNKRVEYFVSKYPNPYQTASQFIYQLVTILLAENNAYVIPILDEFGKTSGLWAASPDSCEIVDVYGQLWLKYETGDGQKQIIEYELCGHLRTMQNKSTLMGESNMPFKKVAALYEQDIDKSMEKLAASESPVQWVGQLNAPILDDEALKEEQDRLNRLNLKGNKTGTFLYDNRYTRMDQVSKETSIMSPDDIKQMENMAYSYWGVGEKLLQNAYTEDEWNGFYQSRIEPILIQIGEVLTKVVFSRNQIMDGNAVEMASNRLQYASIKSRIDVAFGTYDRGMATMDSSLDILNLPPLPNGEGAHRYIRGEYRQEGTPAKSERKEENDDTGNDPGSDAAKPDISARELRDKEKDRV